MKMEMVIGLVFLTILQVNAKALPSNWTSNLDDAGDGNVYFESDIILPRRHVELAVNTGNVKEETSKDENKEDGAMQEITAPLYMRWPGGVVPYVIHKKLKCSLFCIIANPEKHIKNAMKAWTDKTCITFREKTDLDKDYVHFVSSGTGHCASHIGRIRGEQKLYLGKGCRSDGIIMHEIGHTLGFFHEQSRPDRDDYVNIKLENVPQEYWHNFAKYTTGISDMKTPYDYKSIMHYKDDSFVPVWKPFSKSIVPKQDIDDDIGQRDYLSDTDVEEMNRYYKCPK